MIACDPAETLTLQSGPNDIDTVGPDHDDRQDRQTILRLEAADQLRPSPPIPGRLAIIEPVAAQPVTVTRTFELTSNDSINDREFDMERIDEVVTVDTVEKWTVINTNGNPHNFHVHDVQFQVLSYRGAPPPPELAGWKDTLYLPPTATAELVMRFTDYTDAAWPYLYHCHLLTHEDQGMMGQFLVVPPGQAARPAARPPTTAHHS